MLKYVLFILKIGRENWPIAVEILLVSLLSQLKYAVCHENRHSMMP